MCRQSMPEAGSSAAFRSAGRRMSKIHNVQPYVEAPSGGGTCRQVIDLAMPGDVVVPSNIYPRE